jgi:hypothetical protein
LSAWYWFRNRALEKRGLVSCILRANRWLLFSTVRLQRDKNVKPSSLRHRTCGGSKEPHSRFYSFSGDPKYRFGFQSILANTLEQLDTLQGLSSTNLSKRLPSYLVDFQQPPTLKVMKATPELDRSIVQILRLLVPLILPLID